MNLGLWFSTVCGRAPESLTTRAIYYFEQEPLVFNGRIMKNKLT